MQRELDLYLWDNFDATYDIQLDTGGLDYDIFQALSEKQAAVERKFEIMGEAIVQCRHHYPEAVAQLGEVQPVVDFRNYLAHRHHAVSSKIVWDILENDLPPLLERVRVLLPPRPWQHRSSQTEEHPLFDE